MTVARRLPVVCLMGPTGAGKTACALALAARFPLEIVSVDSAQVYRGLDIGSAKPDPVMRRAVPHHLLDICDPAESYSAARFRDDALQCIADIHGRGRVPLLVGGTGLYFRALCQGLAPLPAADVTLRAELQAEHAAAGTGAMYVRLQAVDPTSAARIHPNDPQRILRALEVYRVAGRPMSALLARREGGLADYPLVKWVIAPAARASLHARLRARFLEMLARGLVNEVHALRARRDLDLDRPALRAVGYRAVWQYLEGELTHETMVEAAVVATRQLAKRQYTWFRAERDAQWWESDDRELVSRLAAAFAAETREAFVDYT
jgi:tRNA dimethylallyltransferase